VPASRRYLPGTKVLETTWQTRTGWLVVTDFLAVTSWHRTRDRSGSHRRTPGDFDADHVLIRIATCVHGSVETTLECEPAFDYGRSHATWEYTGAGYDEAATTTPGQVRLRMVGDLLLGHDGRAARARHRLQAGESCFIALGWGTRPPPADLEQARAALAQTERFWRVLPRPSLARAPSAQRPHPQGPHLHAHRGPARRLHHLTARAARR
jgi:GH15 family glucan-1,4-alpha-glucosidase